MFINDIDLLKLEIHVDYLWLECYSYLHMGDIVHDISSKITEGKEVMIRFRPFQKPG